MKKKINLQLKEDQDQYDVGIKDWRFPWHLLWLLLLLLIPIPERIHFKVMDQITNQPLEGATIETVLNKGGQKQKSYKSTTNTDGKRSATILYQLLGARLYNLVVYGEQYSPQKKLSSQASISCFTSNQVDDSLNKLKDTVIALNLKKEMAGLPITVLDKYTQTPIDSASVFIVSSSGINSHETLETNANGHTLYNALRCSDTLTFISSKTGFENDTIKAPLNTLYTPGYTTPVTLSMKQIPEEVLCGSPIKATGGLKGIIKHIDMGRTSGKFRFTYDTYSIPDEIKVYNGKYPDVDEQNDLIFATAGCTTGPGSDNVNFQATSQFISIVVKGCVEGTGWEVSVNCPQ